MTVDRFLVMHLLNIENSMKIVRSSQINNIMLMKSCMTTKTIVQRQTTTVTTTITYYNIDWSDQMIYNSEIRVPVPKVNLMLPVK